MSSAWVPANLPAEVCARVPEFFRVQHCLNYALYPAYRPDAESVARDLRDVLRNTDLRTVPAFMLGSSPRQLAIAREIAAAGASTAEVEYHLATAALLERNYEAAAKHMRRSLHGNGGGPAPPVDLLAAVLAQL